MSGKDEKNDKKQESLVQPDMQEMNWSVFLGIKNGEKVWIQR